jgi:ADP-ribose pyrophosphatase YjhB (NUDIX family)
MTDWHKQAFYRISAIGVIKNANGEYLLCNEHNRWTFPGGAWDYGETLHEALKRELFEEIALTSDITENVITVVPFYNPNKDAWQVWVAARSTTVVNLNSVSANIRPMSSGLPKVKSILRQWLESS